MSSDNSAFVDPSALSLQSPASDAPSPSPAPRALFEPAPGPSRKRARTEMSAEERKEARAHRNRIAAQNSRDKRKHQFSTLERRVAELEEENRQLRAGLLPASVSGSTNEQFQQRNEESEREKARERENAELRERIKSLEKGWEAVMKVLAAQGLPMGAAPTAPAAPASNSESFPTPAQQQQQTILPLTPSPTLTASSVMFENEESESTRHLARVATTAAIPPAVPQQRVDSPATPTDQAMEEWMREVFSTSPIVPSAPVSPVISRTTQSPAVVPHPASLIETPYVDWEQEKEMQRLLDMLIVAQPEGSESAEARPVALSQDMCGEWNTGFDPSYAPSGVGVF